MAQSECRTLLIFSRCAREAHTSSLRSVIYSAQVQSSSSVALLQLPDKRHKLSKIWDFSTIHLPCRGHSRQSWKINGIAHEPPFYFLLINFFAPQAPFIYVTVLGFKHRQVFSPLEVFLQNRFTFTEYLPVTGIIRCFLYVFLFNPGESKQAPVFGRTCNISQTMLE